MMHMLIGNVGSGKSEMAAHMAKKFNAVVVNMDAIQESMHTFYGGYRQELKPVYQATEEMIIEGALKQGVPVIIDRTNMDKKRRARFIEIANKYSAEVNAYIMPQENIEIHLERRMKNARGISENQWAKVIIKMMESYERPSFDEGFEIIEQFVAPKYNFLACDFDGTIVGHNFPEIGDPVDSVIQHMRDFWAKSLFNRIIIWTCRADNYVSEMASWLRQNNVPFDFINENPLVDYGGRKLFANRYLDDRNISLSDIGEMAGDA